MNNLLHEWNCAECEHYRDKPINGDVSVETIPYCNKKPCTLPHKIETADDGLSAVAYDKAPLWCPKRFELTAGDKR